MAANRIICTGITGTDRLDWLRRVVDRARGDGLDVALYDVRDVMFQVARDLGDPVDEETILDMFPRALVLLRATALEKITTQIEARPDQHWILNTHAVFRWKNTLISGFDPYYLTRLHATQFATVTSGVKTVLTRLRAHPRWASITEEDVLVWREEEQFFTQEMARLQRKPQVLLPRTLDAEGVYRLLFGEAWQRTYLGYPMQHVEAGVERGLAAFKQELEQRLVVFDPAGVNDFEVEGESLADIVGNQERSDGSVEITSLAALDERPAAARRDRLQQHIADQIVVRDYQLIEQSDMVVVFYDVPVPSPGVISEMKFALESGKQVFGVWLPKSEPSIFFTRYCSLWFRGPEALFAHLDRVGIRRRTRVTERG